MDATFNSTGNGTGDAAADEPARPGLFDRLWQKRLVVSLTFGLTLFLVIGVLFLLPVSYVASGSLLVAGRDAIAAASSPAPAQKLGEPADVESTILLVRSPRLARKLLGQPGINGALEADCARGARQLVNRLRSMDCAGLADDPDAQLQWIQDRFGVAAVDGSRVVSVTYRSSSPQVAQTMVNGLLQTFLDDERAKLRHSRDEAVDWLHQRLAQLDTELPSDAAAIESFRSLNGLAAGSGAVAAGRLAQAAQVLSEARATLAEAQARLQDVHGAAAPRQSPSTTELRRQLSQASALVASAALRYGSQNPVLLGYRQQEADLAARLAAENGRAGQTRPPAEASQPSEAARHNVDAAKLRLDQAERDLATQTEAASQATGAERQLSSMIRDLDVKRSSSVDLSQRLSQLETERRLLEPSTQLIDLAELPLRPAFPQRTPFLIGGLALATLLSTAAGLLSYRPVSSGPIALGRTYTRVPILAQVPELRLRRSGKKEVARGGGIPFAAAVSLLETHPPLLESIRILHARLTLAGFGTKHRTLLITSEVAGEGKSFVTLALARMARASGHRVLVIEASLRAPFLAEALRSPSGAGLARFLRGGPLETIQLGAVPGVEFLLAGDPMSDSTELLAGPRFRELLDWTRQFDLVLIDSAAVSELMDAALVAQRVDGVVFCLRAGRSPAVNALNSLPEMQRTNGNVVGLVLTFMPDRTGTAPGIGQTRQLPAQPQFQTGPV